MLSIAKHEFGHALGLGHSSNRRDIMYPEYEQRENINPPSPEQIRSLSARGSFYSSNISPVPGSKLAAQQEKKEKT